MQSEGSSYKVTICKNSEKPTGLHPLQSGIGNERVNKKMNRVQLKYKKYLTPTYPMPLSVFLLVPRVPQMAIQSITLPIILLSCAQTITSPPGILGCDILKTFSKDLFDNTHNALNGSLS